MIELLLNSNVAAMLPVGPYKMDSPRRDSKVVTHGNYMYAYGGWTFVDSTIDRNSSQFARMDLNTFTWEILPNGPVAGRPNGIFAYNNEIYIYGIVPATGVSTAELWKYSIELRTWELAANIAEVNFDTGTTLVGPAPSGYYIWIHVGGVTARLVRLDLRTLTWTALATPPKNTTYMKMALAGDEIYMCGGYNRETSSADPAMYFYRISTGVWSFIASGSQGVTPIQHGTLTSNGIDTLYQLGGTMGGTNFTNELRKYNTRLKQWSVVPNVTRYPMYQVTACYYRSRVISYGGLAYQNGWIVEDQGYVIPT